MTTERHLASAPAGTVRRGPRLALAALRAAALGTVLAAGLAPGDMPRTAERCLSCHSMPALSKTMENGDKLSLHVEREPFAESVHARIGCAGCHRDVDPSAHPVPRSFASNRAYVLAKADACRSCHANKYELYDGSIHADLVAAGDPRAPVCSSCHDVHAQRDAAQLATLTRSPCKGCHEDIFEAYRGSVHGQARGAAEAQSGNIHAEAPVCNDCHRTHDVLAAGTGDRITAACLDCHDGARRAHREWLPNADLHLANIACPACHSPLAERAVDLRLYDRNAATLLTDKADDPRFEAWVREIDSEGDGLDPMELWRLVRLANREGVATDITLRGRLEVPRGAEAHQLAVKMDAVRACDTCHEKGAAPFRNVTISVAAPDGRRIHYAADAETLTSPVSVDAVGDFYTAGGTRIGILDVLLVVAVLAGLSIPLTHMAIRKWFGAKH